MNQTLTNFAFSKKSGFLLLLLCALLSFQQGKAQHCFPGFHFSVDGNTVVFDDQSTADGNITAYSWDFGDGNTSTEQNPTHTYAAPGTYNACLTITAHNPNCTETYCHHVVAVHPPAAVCHAAFVAHQPDLAQATIDFTDQSSSDGTIGSWVWDFGDGNTSTEQNPSHTYAEPGTYLVCLTITDDDGGCTSHVCHHVVVHHPPANECHAAFTVHLDATGLGVQFTNTSTGTTDHTTYSWEFGDGTTSPEESPHHTYAHSGHYTVCLFIADATTGCSSHICHTINVHHGGGHHHYHPHHIDGIELADTGNESGEARSMPQSVILTNYPNPFVGSTTIAYAVAVESKVKFEVYSLTGARVAEVMESTKPAGEYSEVMPVGSLLPGEYVLKMTVNGAPYMHRITVMQ